MKSRSVLIVGFGDIGLRVSEELMSLGADVAAVRRSADKLPAPITAYEADYTVSGSLAFCENLAPDYVLATFIPSDRSEEGYRKGFEAAMDNLLQGLGQHRPRHIFMASSTRVYAEREGGWVDEGSELSSTDARAAAIISAEQKLLASEHSSSIVRFAGIYGYASGRLIERIKRGEVSPAKPVHYTNRIHREDCAGFLTYLICLAEQGEQLEPVYTGVDDYPAPRHEVETWLAAELGVLPTPRAEQLRQEDSGVTAHKRCRNTGLKATGYQLKFPDYRAGYRATLAR
jgi:nucleoside-diphosphate-sugar epimerase